MRFHAKMGRLVTGGVAAMLMLAFFSLPGLAAFEFASGKNVVVEKNRVIDGDLYAAGQTAVVDGTVRGDLIVGARTVVVNGRVEGSLLAAGGNITVNGPVAGNIRAAGQSITLNSTVGKNVTIASESALIGPSAVVGGGIIGGHARLEALGTVNGDLLVGANEATLGGKVDGLVRAHVEDLLILPETKIAGAVTYYSPKNAEIDKSAQIQGEVRHELTRKREEINWYRVGRIADAVWFAGIILLGILLWLFYPARVEAATIPRLETWTRGFLTGLAGLVLGPVLIVLAFVTVVGSPVALALLGGYLVAMLFTIPLAGPLAARQVLAAYFPETRLHPVAVAAPMRACSEEEERFVSLSEDCFMDEKHEGHYAEEVIYQDARTGVICLQQS
ncbi:MAG: polymer-forming cytoskeletal protein [Firmicutes bacterium]|nr:polymer-forming cytoskeletal protein [Bacillota bacterium]